jgi:hypothetical protein
LRDEPIARSGRASKLLAGAVLGVIALLSGALPAPNAFADSVVLAWTATGDDGNSGRASSYEMRYSVNPVGADTAAWWASAISVGTMPAPLQGGTRESFIVAGLVPSTTFYFAIRASDEVPNVSGFSNIAVKQTAGGSVPLATPGNFSGGITPGAVLLTWTAIPSGGAELGYRLYRKADGDPVSTLLSTLPLTATSWNDSTAAAGTSYDFSLAAYGDAGEGTPASLRVTIPGVATAALPVVHGYPNPARDRVTFKVNIEGTSDQRTRVMVYDLTGHKICLIADQVLPPGENALSWLCRSDTGHRVAPGLYNVIVDGPSGRAVTRIAVVP